MYLHLASVNMTLTLGMAVSVIDITALPKWNETRHFFFRVENLIQKGNISQFLGICSGSNIVIGARSLYNL
jgi:hypothetical protein